MSYGEKILEKILKKEGDVSFCFMPYKYSMWDSMETLYDACIEKNIETYLSPVSYYTKTDGVWHDESEEFGCVDKDGVKMADVIVIHNPYDNKNKLTSIDPEYYSWELKRMGKKIVYLAYMGAAPRDGFILQPGVMYADYIFTETEEEAERYVSAWKNQGINKADNVFCVGGLPKYESIKDDGFKPIDVLVCGSLTPFLESPMDRIRRWKRTIEKYDGNIVFRPHPLLEDGIRWNCPGMMSHYKGFLLWCKNKGVIVDVTADNQRVLRGAKFLTSDPSSILEMWKRTGKEYEVM